MRDRRGSGTTGSRFPITPSSLKKNQSVERQNLAILACSKADNPLSFQDNEVNRESDLKAYLGMKEEIKVIANVEQRARKSCVCSLSSLLALEGWLQPLPASTEPR